MTPVLFNNLNAIEEALSNAVYHRNYELQAPIEVRVLPNAIEIISYNGVDPSLKQDDFDKGIVRARRYRNRRIGEFLKELRLTEGRGTGIPTIVKALKDNGSGSPKFDTNEPHRNHFLIEIPIHPEFNDQVNKLTKEQIKILKYCEQRRSNKDIQEQAFKLKVHTDNFKRHIAPIIREGLLERTIPNKHRSPNQEYVLTNKGKKVLALLKTLKL
ncbi:ATP-binding protein [Flavivirga aquimarina]|uniref:ATP-binding protein n=1 Tax=Flavivirga aquimarina TaxID=2027862 RepID=A0ABT8WAA5_9FLAO|nr:ATP-binding protein [Flavivirga aquimarina]MDO5970075.1 ATP-binding protein [Flavivirga aquimarina]